VQRREDKVLIGETGQWVSGPAYQTISMGDAELESLETNPPPSGGAFSTFKVSYKLEEKVFEVS
jgi:hypothetical protein